MSLEALRIRLTAPPERRRRGPLVAASVLVIVIAVAVAFWARPTTPRVVAAVQSTRRFRPAPSTLPSTTSTTAAAVRVWPTTTLPPLVVQHGDGQFAVGAADDHVAVGAFRCADQVLALLRGDDVFLFTSWADYGVDAVGAPVGHVDGATGLHAEPSGDGCDAIVVDRTEEAPVRINP
ncbi:MAG: hypothetical protein JOY57_16845 [Actinobacteria bacterium]|nr:hypothetical protein [Actinomycetota bacterium]